MFTAIFTSRFTVQITTHEGVLGYLDNYQFYNYWLMFIHKGVYGSGILYAKAAQTVVLNTSSPLVMESGQARCAWGKCGEGGLA